MSSPPTARIQAHKNWLKRLAAERRAGWMIAVRPRSLDGATAIETKREVIHLEDGVVMRVSPVAAPLEGGDDNAAAPNTGVLVGMRIVGWVGEGGSVYGEYVHGARAILFRKESGDDQTSLALTGRVRCFVIVKRSVTGSLTLPRSSRTRESERSRSDARPRSGIQRASRSPTTV